MSTYRIEWLPAGMSWNPISLLALPPEATWRGARSFVKVETLASLIGRAAPAPEELPVVTPAGIDRITGRVLRTRRGYTGVVRRLGNDPEDLSIGDVLVPASGVGPAVLLASAHEGLAFSGSFHALHPKEPWAGIWLWACLSARSGERARKAAVMSAGGSLGRLTAAALLEMRVPSPDDALGLLDSLDQLATATAVVDRAESATSWWRISELPADGRWHPQALMRDPNLLERGVPLSALADVQMGRRPKPSHEAPRPGLLPVRQGKSIDGRAVSAWAAPGTAPDVSPGDVLVAEIGLRGRAVLADARALAGPGIIRIRPFDPKLSDGIAAYFRSEAAQAVRQQLVAAAVIPRLSLAVIRRFPVELKPTHPQESSEFQMSLAERLEQMLWNN